MPAPRAASLAAARPSQCAVSVAETSPSTRVTCGAKRERGVERMLERGGIGDHRELADTLLPRRELEARVARVAANDHVVDRRRRVRSEARPRP